MIIVSDMELGGGDKRSRWGGHGWHGPGGTGRPHSRAGAHLSPGMSSRLVIPVQLMSKVWLGGGNGVRWGGQTPAPSCLGGAGAAGPTGGGGGHSLGAG